MKRIVITVVATLLAAVPASLGLIGNTSFAQSVPVEVPSQAVVVDDRGGLNKHVGPGDDLVSESSSGRDDNGGHGGDANGKIRKDDGSERS